MAYSTEVASNQSSQLLFGRRSLGPAQPAVHVPHHQSGDVHLRAIMDEIERHSRQHQYNREADFRWQMELDQRYYHEVLAPRTRPATRDDYQTWFTGFHTRGATATTGSRPRTGKELFPSSPDRNWLVATNNLITRPLFGASALDLIVPDGIVIEIHSGDDQRPSWSCGHSNLYFIDGYQHQGRQVATFADVR